jgi:uncharacterized protein
MNSFKRFCVRRAFSSGDKKFDVGNRGAVSDRLRSSDVTDAPAAKKSVSVPSNVVPTTIVPAWDSSKFDVQSLSSGKSQSFMTGASSQGFQINAVGCYGGVMIFPRFFTLWDQTTVELLHLDSFRLVFLHQPKISEQRARAIEDENGNRIGLVLLGTGDRTHQIPEAIAAGFRARGVRIESMPSKAAGSTFNMLNDECRDVACCLLSPTNVCAKDDVSK